MTDPTPAPSSARSVRIPLPPRPRRGIFTTTEAGTVTVDIPYPLTPDEWDYLFTALFAMQEGICQPTTTNDLWPTRPDEEVDQ